MSRTYYKPLYLVLVWFIVLPVLAGFALAEENLAAPDNDQANQKDNLVSPEPENPVVSPPAPENSESPGDQLINEEIPGGPTEVEQQLKEVSKEAEESLNSLKEQAQNEAELLRESSTGLQETLEESITPGVSPVATPTPGQELPTNEPSPTPTVGEENQPPNNAQSPLLTPGPSPEVISPTPSPTPTPTISPTPTVGGVSSTSLQAVDNRKPKLVIKVDNNVGDFIYENDMVIFTVTVENFGSSPSHNTTIVHRIYNGKSEDIGGGEYNLGTLDTNTVKTQSFILTVQDDSLTESQLFYSKTQVLGYGPDGKQSLSSQEYTSFEVKPIISPSVVGQVESRNYFGVDSGSVLGQSSDDLSPQVAGIKTQRKDISPYMLTLFLSALWFLEKSKKWIKRV